jgi:hypothetical protein
MWLSSLLLSGFLATTPAAVQVNLPQACFVYGEVFYSAAQVTAMLSSNCPIRIERKDRLVTLKGPQRVIEFMIPEEPGVHEFVYRWGQNAAHFDDGKLEMLSGPLAGGGNANVAKEY